MLALLLLAAAAPAPAADVTALREAKLVAWPKYYRENDWRGLEGFLTEDFRAFSSDGSVETRGDAVAYVKSTPWAGAANNFRYEIKDIVFHSADIANVYGVGSMDGKDCRMAYTSANIFVKRAGRWHPAYSHTSRAACVTPGK